jgi:hypothetical protein
MEEAKRRHLTNAFRALALHGLSLGDTGQVTPKRRARGHRRRKKPEAKWNKNRQSTRLTQGGKARSRKRV